MSMLDKRVLELGNKFHGRLDKLWLDVALDNVDYDECGLAFELLCDYIVDFDIPISKAEYDEIIKLAADMEIDFSDYFSRCLKSLILHEDENGDRYFVSSKLGKILLPRDWPGEKMLHEIEDILTTPDVQWYVQTGHGKHYTNSGVPARWVTYEVRDNERIKLVCEPATWEIVTAHPYDRPIPHYTLAS